MRTDSSAITSPQKNRFRRALLLILLTGEIAILPAQNLSWSNNPQDANWTNSNNWNPGTVPNSSTAKAQFGNTSEPGISISSATIDVGTIAFTGAAPEYTFTLQNGQFTLHNALTNLSSNSPLFNMVTPFAFNLSDTADMAPARVAVGQNTQLSIGSLTAPSTSIGALSGGGTVNLGTKSLYVGALGLDTTFSGQINGNSGANLYKQGTGTFTMTGSFSNSGLLQVIDGTVAIQTPQNQPHEWNGLIVGAPGGAAATLTATGSGDLNVGSGGTSVGAGTTGFLTVSAGNAALNTTRIGISSQGTMTVQGPSTTVTTADITTGAGLIGAVNVSGGASLTSNNFLVGNNASGSNGTVTLAGAGSKIRSGTVTLGAAANTAGEIDIGTGGSFTASSALLANASGSSATVSVDGSGSAFTSSANIGVAIQGNATMAITNGGIVSAQTLSVSPNGNTGSITVDGSGSTLNAGTVSLLTSGAGIFLQNQSAMTSTTENITGGILSIAAGTSWTNSGNFTVGGGPDQAVLRVFDRSSITSDTGTVLSNGIVRIGAEPTVHLLGQTNGLILDGGIIQAANNVTLIGPFMLGSGGGTFDTNGYNATVTGQITGSGLLTETGSGTLTLIGADTYSGGTINSQGTLAFSGNTALGTGPVTLHNGTTLRNLTTATIGNPIVLNGAVTLDTPADLVHTSVISGNGSLTDVGPGTLTLTGSSTYTGPTIVNGGSLFVNGSITSDVITSSALGGAGSMGSITLDTNSRLYPGSAIGAIGTLNAGSLMWNAGTIVFDLNTPTDSDLLNLSGALTKGSGTSQSILINYLGPPDPTDAFTLIEQTSTTFTASDIKLLAADTGLHYALEVNPSNVRLVNTSPAPLVPSCPTSLENPPIDINADFEVCGTVPAANSGNSSVNSLLFNDASALVIGAEVSVSSGAVVSNPDANSSITGGTLTSSAGLVFNTPGTATQTVSSTIAGGSGFSLTKVGSGTLVLSANNTYSGRTNVNEGILDITSSDALGISIVDVEPPATLNLMTGSALGSNSIVNFGTITFFDTSSAGTSNVANTGVLNFQTSSSAGSSTITNGAGGRVNFNDQSMAGASTINNAGTIMFSALSSAGSSNLTNQSNSQITFVNSSTSGASTITNSGLLFFENGANAGTSNITTSSGGYTAFLDSSSAISATLITDSSGFTRLQGSSTAGNATIITNGGGTTELINLASGGTATVVTNAGGVFDIDSLAIAGTTVGSIAGAGSYLLGTKDLTTGLNNMSTLVDGVISGVGGSLTKVGSGTLVLAGDNTYTGATTISAGTLQIGNGGSTGSVAGNIVNDAALVFNRSDTMTYGGVISGTGSLTQAGTGTTILTGTNVYSGGTIISSGTLQIGNGDSLGSVSGNINDNGTLIFNRSDGVVYDGVISGTGSLVQIGGSLAGAGAGTGTLVLTGSNTYTGGTTIAGGALQIGNGGTSGSIIGDIIDNGSLVFNRSDAISYSGVISGTGAVTQAGAGTLALTATNTYSGGTNINNGILAVSRDANLGALAGPLTLAGGTLQTLAAISSTRNITLNSGGGGIDTNGFSSLFGGVISGPGSLTKTGAGTLVLTGDNSYTGATTISAGTLQIGNGGTTGSVSGNITDNGMLAFNRSDAIEYLGVISGTGAVTQAGAGTLALTATNTYSGGTNINNGILAISSDANLGVLAGPLTFARGTLQTRAAMSSARNIILNSGGGAIDTNGVNSVFGGVISGPGSLTKTGAGVLTLNGMNIFSGGTTLLGGTLAIGSSSALGLGNLVNSGGTIQASNSPMAIRVNGDFTQTTAGTLSLNIGGRAPGQYDQLLVHGQAQIGGTLRVNLTNSFMPKLNDVYPVVQASQVTGTFSNLLFPSTVRFLIDYLSNQVDLRVVPGQYPFGQITGLTVNQTNIGNYLDQYITTPRQLSDDFNSVLMAMGSVDTNGVKNAINQISPQVYEIYKKIAFQQAVQRARLISDRLDSVRAAANQDDQMPLFGYSQPVLLASAAPNPIMPFQMLMMPNWQGTSSSAGPSEPAYNWFYFNGTGDFGRFGGTADLAKSSFTSGGWTVGADHRFGHHFAAGLQYAFVRTTADLGNSNGNAYISSYSPVGYLSVFSKHAYAEAAYAPSYNTYYGVRHIAFSTINRTAISLSNGWNHAGEFTTGYDAAVKHWTLGPYARAIYDNFRVQAIEEIGAGSLDLMIHRMKAESLRTELGGRIRGMFKTSDHAVFRPTMEGAWVHESLDDSTPIIGALSEPGGGQFIVYTSRPVRNGFAGRAGLEAVVMPNLSFFIDYGIQTSLNNGTIQGVWGGARIWF